MAYSSPGLGLVLGTRAGDMASQHRFSGRGGPSLCGLLCGRPGTTLGTS